MIYWIAVLAVALAVAIAVVAYLISRDEAQLEPRPQTPTGQPAP